MTIDSNRISEIQAAIRSLGFDGWLFCDFHNRDPIGYRILGLDIKHPASRRWYYLIPAQGEPVKLVHRVESSMLMALPGRQLEYSGWKELHKQLGTIIGRDTTVAMQYSPLNAVPVVSTVDAGTVELIRSMGAEVVSSGDLVGLFEAAVDEDAFQTHARAGKAIHAILDDLWPMAAEGVKRFNKHGEAAGITECEIQGWILDRFREAGLDWENHKPVVAINDHAADPHFEPDQERDRVLKPGDLLLVDLWAKQAGAPHAVYYDVTWMGQVPVKPDQAPSAGGPGDNVAIASASAQKLTEEQAKVFTIARDARNRALIMLQQRISQGEKVMGYEVDRVCREHIESNGYGEYFVHRTGHSIGTSVHGNGVNMDDFETRDMRQILPGTLFSIEPGIYLRGRFGIRTEINVYVDRLNNVMVTGPRQESLIIIK